MSFLSKLELDGGSYNILECSYEFTQSIDSMGKPQGMPKGGEIRIRIESMGKPIVSTSRSILMLMIPSLYKLKWC